MENEAAVRAKISRLGFTTDAGAGARARIGLLVLESDQTMEWEMRLMTHLSGVSVYHARLANDVVVTPETLAKMEAELPVAAGLLPQYLGLSALGYGCTSGSTIIGEDRVAAILDTAHPGVPSSNPLTAAKAAAGNSKAAARAQETKRRMRFSVQKFVSPCLAVTPSICRNLVELWLSIGDFPL